MGSWYGTCALTNMPIYQGDKAVFFMLAKNYSHDHHICEVYDHYAPLGLPIFGTYNDSDALERVEDQRIEDPTAETMYIYNREG